MTGHRWRTGLVIGKFLPPHLGHGHLIDAAAEQVDDLTVVVFARSDEPIAFEVRRSWLRELHPGVRFVGGVDDHEVDFDDDDTWRYWVDAIRRAFDRGDGRDRPDVVFSSEDYGAELAARLGGEHVLVDLDRTAHRVSGSLVRGDPFAAWDHLPAPVRAWFVRRVVIVGAESTGKTVLAARLAERFDTVWVPEYGRAYSEERGGLDDPWTSDEFTRIARRQNDDEDAAARIANRVLIGDTDTLATGIWHEFYVDGARSPEVEALIRPADLYLLAAPDVAWVDDGLRDGEHRRHWMTERFRTELRAHGARVVEFDGSWAEREERAAAAIEALLAEPWAGASYLPAEKGQTRRV